MQRHFLLALMTSAALTAPLAAQAQVNSSVTMTATVNEACVVGDPSVASLDFLDLTGSDGLVNPALASKEVVISTAWCNTPGKLKLSADPLRLDSPVGNAPPAGFARTVTFNANLAGWTEALFVRPLADDTEDEAIATPAAYAATQLTLTVGGLAAVNGAGAESATAVLEAGAYNGNVTVSVAVD